MDEFTDEELIRSGLNPYPTCWSDSGLSPVERASMQRVSEQYPHGAYAAFVRLMDKGEAARTTDREEHIMNNCIKPPHFPPHCGCPAEFHEPVKVSLVKQV